MRNTAANVLLPVRLFGDELWRMWYLLRLPVAARSTNRVIRAYPRWGHCWRSEGHEAG